METLDCGLMSHTGDPPEFLSKSFTSMAGRMGKRTSIRTNQNWLGAGPKKVAMEGAIKSFPAASLPRKQTESQATEIGKSRDVSPSPAPFYSRVWSELGLLQDPKHP